MKNVYEIFDEFEEAKTKQERLKIIEKNLSKILVEVLELTFHPNYQWHITDVPDNYIEATNNLPGLSPLQLSTQIRKLYLFKKGDETADKLTPEKMNQLLLQILESLEPREAEVVFGILRKDQGVKGLTYKFVKDAFPQMLP